MRMRPTLILALAVGLLAIQASAQETATLTTQKDKVSYGIGVQVAASLKGQGIDVDPNLLVKGLKDALSGQKLLMSDEELSATMAAFQQEMVQKQTQARAQAAAENKKTGDTILASNGKKDGVVTLPSCLGCRWLPGPEWPASPCTRRGKPGSRQRWTRANLAPSS